jgi:hypothetical protein
MSKRKHWFCRPSSRHEYRSHLSCLHALGCTTHPHLTHVHDRSPPPPRYVERVWRLHCDFDNLVEYGIALQLHASFYSYASTKLLDATDGLPAEQERLRKVRLALLAVDAYDQGEVWERSLAICQELAGAFQNVLCAAFFSLFFLRILVSRDTVFRLQ